MRKFLKLILTLSIFVISGLFLSGCDEDIIMVVGVDFYQEEIFVSVGEQLDLSHKVYPNNASNSKVTYWSSDPNIASVDEAGHVTVKDFGEAMIAIRTVDGGFEDYCKIITDIDPDEIRWNTSDGRILKSNHQDYSGETTVAIGQVIKLEIDYILAGKVSDEVTNRSVTFTSSNPENIEVINASEGILRAVDSNVKNVDNIPYSDITATLQTASGEKKIVCRVSVNEYSTVDKLFVNQVEGDVEILSKRDGSETIYLDAEDDIGLEYYAYLLNESNFKKTDFRMTIKSEDESKFKVENCYDVNNITYFRLLPIAEGSANLIVDTTCYNENGKQVRCVINVVVQSAVESVDVSASEKQETTFSQEGRNHEIVVSGDIFSINFKYYDGFGRQIDNAVRNVYFYGLDSYCLYDTTNEEYIYNVKYTGTNYTKDGRAIDMIDKEIVGSPCDSYIIECGNNKFKVSSVPQNINNVFCIQGYVSKENHSNISEEENRTYFCYFFYIRNDLQGIIATKQASQVGGEIPMTGGIDEVTIATGLSDELYVYTFAFFENQTSPANITYTISDTSLISVTKNGDRFTISSVGVDDGSGNIIYSQGEGVVTFTATDGVNTVSINVLVHIV